MTIKPLPGQVDSVRFAREVEPQLEVLARGARRLTHNDADAEDLLQDTLLHAYSGFDSFDGTKLRAWLFRILHNRWVSAHRAKQRRPVEVPVDVITDGQLDGNAARAGTTPRSAEAEALDSLPDHELKAALAGLPEGFRTVLYYADVLDYTYAETAALLKIPIGTVMSRVSRGRHRLRIALAHRADGGVTAAPDRRIA